jgi:hypothetical protein
MSMKRGKIGKNNSHALRNVGNFSQTLAPSVVWCRGAVTGFLYGRNRAATTRLAIMWGVRTRANLCKHPVTE